MAKIHTSAPSPAHSRSHIAASELLVDIPNSDESASLHQRAINGLSDALEVLRTSPMAPTDLEQALGRGTRGITALKRLKSLSGSVAGTARSLGVSDMPRRQAVPPLVSQLTVKERRTRRYFDSDYKRQVVQLIRQQHMSASQASKALNLAYSVVRRWMMEFDSEQAVIGTAKPTISDAERIRALEDRLRQLQADNELLKKASALFAREICSAESARTDQ